MLETLEIALDLVQIALNVLIIMLILKWKKELGKKD